ncbi:MAG: GntR family transcriptional regulator [Planctomycetota bacterium]
MVSIKITTGGNRAIYQQVVDQIRSAIAAEKLTVGQSLPSVRGLAEQLAVNHNTIAKAYAELVRDGTLESRPGRGMFVCQKRNVLSAAERRRRTQQAVDVFLAEMLALDLAPEQIREVIEAKLNGFAVAQKS